VRVEDVADVEPVKRRLGIPTDVTSCHTAQVGGYIVEGHVPADAIDRILAERPDIAGLAVPGMPEGAPGMALPGRPEGDYTVISFTEDGELQVYERR
jgi:hypothetical protein